ncbi:MAG: GNAT family N-acetyltransferase [Phreatobacter sp.]|nr:GNAT family N-acetyltransferase [Phreatobacter sp.]
MTAFAWRAMTAADLAAVSRIAAAVHPDFPEDDAVFAERRELCPNGCRVLVHGNGGHSDGDRGDGLAGYVLSHPWLSGSCPPLNAHLGALPVAADTFYIHDLALLPSARGSGAAGAIVDQLRATARDAGFAHLSLVAVNNSGGFWRRQGFEAVDGPGLAAKLLSYGEDARLMMHRLP